MKLKQTGELPPINEPWNLIRCAIADLKKQEKLDSVVIDMGIWHSPGEYDGKCHQCLAGAVMSRRLGVDTKKSATPYIAFTQEVNKQLVALDEFRRGAVYHALQSLGMGEMAQLWVDTYKSYSLGVTPYRIDAVTFKSDMLKMADKLEELAKKL